jgi:hypothetical protein
MHPPEKGNGVSGEDKEVRPDCTRPTREYAWSRCVCGRVLKGSFAGSRKWPPTGDPEYIHTKTGRRIESSLRTQAR